MVNPKTQCATTWFFKNLITCKWIFWSLKIYQDSALWGFTISTFLRYKNRTKIDGKSITFSGCQSLQHTGYWILTNKTLYCEQNRFHQGCYKSSHPPPQHLEEQKLKLKLALMHFNASIVLIFHRLKLGWGIWAVHKSLMSTEHMGHVASTACLDKYLCLLMILLPWNNWHLIQLQHIYVCQGGKPSKLLLVNKHYGHSVL